jgi:hypothetical protein
MVNGNGGVWNLEEDETTKCEATGSVRAVFSTGDGDLPLTNINLVGGIKHFLFSPIYGIILPID